MHKKILLFLALSFLFFLVPSKIFANSQFDISADSTYSISEGGVTKVTQDVAITNKTEFYFTPSYTLKVGFSDVSQIEAYNQDGTIPATFDASDPENKSIKLTFPKRYAGLNKSNEFTVKFVTHDIAVKKGNIWEVTIPGLDERTDFSSYEVRVNVPKSFGQSLISKPQKSSKGPFTFSKDEIGKSGIFLLFGDKQYYSFDLNYNISNPNLFPVKTEIALPPATNYQDVLINSISEKPENVKRDADGNWIAEYRLLPQEKKTVLVKGEVVIFPVPEKESLSTANFKEYTASKKYWDAADKLVLSKAEDLKTPEDIYNFVQDTLSYNRNKVATDNLRLGGRGAINDPKNSVCLEFTDLFISLARAKGIPAREVEGFAYTSNSKLRPLSLVGDILHAWPEYYDRDKKVWIMVDPTWGKTTNGMDYFNSLDFDHFAFTVNGSDSEYPIPAGGYKFSKDSKDVTVTFSRPENFRKKEDIKISSTFPDAVFPKFAIKGTITVSNNGNTAISNKAVEVTTSTGVRKDFAIDYIPPFGHKDITTSFPDTPLLTNNKYQITIHFDKKISKKSVAITLVPDIKFLLIFGGIIGVSIITAAVTFHTGSLLVQRQKRKNSLRR